MKGLMRMRKLRTAFFLFFLLALAAAVLLCIRAEETSCMDVPILSERQQEELGRYVKRDFSWDLQVNGQQAAVDVPSSTIYIAQNIQPGTKPEDLLGTLRINSASVQLSFAPDEAFADLAAAVEKGHAFKLNARYGSDKYMQYNLVFTTLPVLRIDGEAIGKNEKGKDICQGSMCLWTPLDPETGRYSVKESHALWNVRGGWSATLDKTPFKLSLKNQSGANKDLSLLGLGADDDWILNPMNLDDTKLKEKLFSGLWNQRAEQVDWNEKMSRGEYVEVVINQQYWGLFQLQRRVDDKFLELDADAVLLKGYGLRGVLTAEEAYEIVHSNLTEADTYSLVQAFFAGTDRDILDMENFLDANLFIQWGSASDNLLYRNMYYLLKQTEKGYQMHLLPWDTDMSWGTVWDNENGGFVYDFETSSQQITLRQEYAWMQQYHPELDRKMAERWFELRETLLTMENITEILEQEQQVLEVSGARQRDTARWGLYYEGADSPENLYRSIEARLAWAEDYYYEYLQ